MILREDIGSKLKKKNNIFLYSNVFSLNNLNKNIKENNDKNKSGVKKGL